MEIKSWILLLYLIGSSLNLNAQLDTLVLDVSEKSDNVYCEYYGKIYSFSSKTTPMAYTIYTSKDSALYNGVLVTIEKTTHSNSSYRIKTDYLTLIDGNPIAGTGNIKYYDKLSSTNLEKKESLHMEWSFSDTTKHTITYFDNGQISCEERIIIEDNHSWKVIERYSEDGILESYAEFKDQELHGQYYSHLGNFIEIKAIFENGNLKDVVNDNHVYFLSIDGLLIDKNLYLSQLAEIGNMTLYQYTLEKDQLICDSLKRMIYYIPGTKGDPFNYKQFKKTLKRLNKSCEDK